MQVRMLASHMGLSITAQQRQPYETIVQTICMQFRQTLNQCKLQCAIVQQESEKITITKSGADAANEVIQPMLTATANMLQLLNTSQIHNLLQKMVADLNTKTTPEKIGENIIKCTNAIILLVINPIIWNMYYEDQTAKDLFLLSQFIQALIKNPKDKLPECLQTEIKKNNYSLLLNMLKNFYPNQTIPEAHKAAIGACLATPTKVIEQTPTAIKPSSPPSQISGGLPFTTFSPPRTDATTTAATTTSVPPGT